MDDYLDFSGKVAVVTGGRRGLGRAMAVALARHGAKVAIVSKSTEANDALGEIRALGGEAAYIQSDLARRDERAGLMEKIRSRFGRLASRPDLFLRPNLRRRGVRGRSCRRDRERRRDSSLGGAGELA